MASRHTHTLISQLKNSDILKLASQIMIDKFMARISSHTTKDEQLCFEASPLIKDGDRILSSYGEKFGTNSRSISKTGKFIRYNYHIVYNYNNAFSFHSIFLSEENSKKIYTLYNRFRPSFYYTLHGLQQTSFSYITFIDIIDSMIKEFYKVDLCNHIRQIFSLPQDTPITLSKLYFDNIANSDYLKEFYYQPSYIIHFNRYEQNLSNSVNQYRDIDHFNILVFPLIKKYAILTLTVNGLQLTKQNIRYHNLSNSDINNIGIYPITYGEYDDSKDLYNRISVFFSQLYNINKCIRPILKPTIRPLSLIMVNLTNNLFIQFTDTNNNFLSLHYNEHSNNVKLIESPKNIKWKLMGQKQTEDLYSNVEIFDGTIKRINNNLKNMLAHGIKEYCDNNDVPGSDFTSFYNQYIDSIGIHYLNLAKFCAKHNYIYTDKDAHMLVPIIRFMTTKITTNSCTMMAVLVYNREHGLPYRAINTSIYSGYILYPYSIIRALNPFTLTVHYNGAITVKFNSKWVNNFTKDVVHYLIPYEFIANRFPALSTTVYKRQFISFFIELVKYIESNPEKCWDALSYNFRKAYDDVKNNNEYSSLYEELQRLKGCKKKVIDRTMNDEIIDASKQIHITDTNIEKFVAQCRYYYGNNTIDAMPLYIE